jgi:DNA-binding CsgD family transcriptional regulator
LYASGYTTDEIANAIGKSSSTVSKYLRGKE